jgi:hypothetical protein
MLVRLKKKFMISLKKYKIFSLYFKKSREIIFVNINNAKDFFNKILNLFILKKNYKAICNKNKIYFYTINSWTLAATKINTFIEIK